LGGVVVYGVLVEQDGDESGGGDGDEGSDDTGEGGSEEEGDEDGETHEIDAVTHDSWSEDSVLEVGVDGVEEKDAGHLGP